MYKRLLNIPSENNQSFFLFGPRGVGKTTWLKKHFPKGVYLDLLDSSLYRRLLARPETVTDYIPPKTQALIILDEIQKIPSLLNEVHKLIEEKQYQFILTGSSARVLRKKGVNLLAGRALTFHMYPLTRNELKKQFDVQHSLTYGNLPLAYTAKDPQKYLESYVTTYLQEEVLQEGLTRNIGNFSRFLETASFSQGSVINYSQIAREAQLKRKTVEGYFEILNDSLIAFQVPVFAKRAKRRLLKSNKFYFYDVGVFRTIRPQGPLDSVDELEGAALETLFFQEIIAMNDYLNLGYKVFFWRTSNGQEVDIVLYGPKGLFAFEVKRKKSINTSDLSGLNAFGKDYPESKAYVVYMGNRTEYHGDITFLPVQKALNTLPNILN